MTREEVVQHLREMTGGRMPEREARLHATAMDMSMTAVGAKLADDAAQRDEAVKLMQDLCFAALTYARPIVTEECAVLVEAKAARILGDKPIDSIGPTMAAGLMAFKQAAAAIREHGRGKP